MTDLVVMYRTPADVAAFDKHYSEVHIPIAQEIPGLRKFEISRGAVMTPGGPSDFHLIARLQFDSPQAIQMAFASPQGQRAAQDVQSFATGGVEMLIFDHSEI